MKRDLARLLRRTLNRLDPPPIAGSDAKPIFTTAIPDRTPFEIDEQAELERRDTALELMDPDTLAYCMVRVVRDGEDARVDINWCVPTALQPAVAHTLVGIANQASGVRL